MLEQPSDPEAFHQCGCTQVSVQLMRASCLAACGEVCQQLAEVPLYIQPGFLPP